MTSISIVISLKSNVDETSKLLLSSNFKSDKKNKYL